MKKDEQDSLAPKDRTPAKPKRNGIVRSLLIRIMRIWPLEYVFNILKKIASIAGFSSEVENLSAADPTSPRVRRFLCSRKRIGRLTRIILYFTPHRLQCVLGYHECLGQATAIDEIKKSPLKPCGKGSKRKQDDLDLEEQHSWVTFMNEDLPNEDEPDDPTYEPSKSDTDSEEQHSKNDTESDLETEERDGIVMLKESVDQEDSLSKQKQTNAEEQLSEQNPNHNCLNASEEKTNATED